MSYKMVTQSIPITVDEAIQIGKHTSCEAVGFAMTMADRYGITLASYGFDYSMFFLGELFNAGWIAGIRHERASRKRP